MEIEMKKILFLSFLSVMGMQSSILCSEQWKMSDTVKTPNEIEAAEEAAFREVKKIRTARYHEYLKSLEGNSPKKWWTRLYEFFDGTPEQKAAREAAKIEKEIERVAAVAAKLEQEARAARAEQRRLDRENERDKWTRAYVRECRENKRPVDYSVYD